MGLWDNHGPRRLIMELRRACSPIKLDICYASTCSTVRLTTRLQLDRPRSTSTIRTAPRPPTQHIDHPRSTSTIRAAHLPTHSASTARTAPRPTRSTSTTDTAHRPPAQCLDQRAAHRPTRSNTTSKHKQIRAEIRHHTYNTQRFSPLPISIPAKQISIICNPSSHRIQISVSPMQNPQKCSIARSKFYQTQKIAFCK